MGDGRALVERAFDPSTLRIVKSGTVRADLRVSGVGIDSLRRPLTVTVRGPFGPASPGRSTAFSPTVEYSVGGKSGVRRMSVGVDPVSVLGTLDPTGWTGDAVVVGEERVRGVETYHVAAKVEYGALARRVADWLAGLAGSSILNRIGGPEGASEHVYDSVRAPTIEIWIGRADNVPRLFLFGTDYVNPYDVLQTGRVTLSFEIGSLNEVSDATASPPADGQALVTTVERIAACAFVGRLKECSGS